jgi:hypothetical protein
MPFKPLGPVIQQVRVGAHAFGLWQWRRAVAGAWSLADPCPVRLSSGVDTDRALLPVHFPVLVMLHP